MRKLSWTVGACSAALFLGLAWPVFFRLIFPASDIGTFHVPMRYLYQQALHAGDSLLWTSSVFAGFYIHGEGQLGAFHPLHQLLYRVLPLDIAMNVQVLASYAWGFAGTYLIVETFATGRQLLSVSERFHEGWSVSEQGIALDALRVNGDFLGVVLEPGTHRVEFRFAPASFRLGVMASAAGALALLAGVIAMRRSGRRR